MPLPQKEAEAGLVASLMRRYGEGAGDALARVTALPIGLTQECIQDPKWSELFQAILDNAVRDIPTSAPLAAQATGIAEFDLRGLVESTDIDALPLYAESVMYHAQRRRIEHAADTAKEIAGRLDPDDALDAITRQFHDVLLTEDKRVGTIAQRAVTGRRFIDQRQRDLRANRPMVKFPIRRLNYLLPTILPGQVVLLTAATKVGKSTWCSQLFDYNVGRGLRGIYFHFEDPPEVMHMRRLARYMVRYVDGDGHPTRPIATFNRLVARPEDGKPIFLTEKEMESIDLVEQIIADELGDRGIEVYAGGWTMDRAVRMWHYLDTQARHSGNAIDFVVIDYLNKAEIGNERGIYSEKIYAARGRDAELVKQTAEQLGTVAVLIQQESDEGQPYETRQSLQKSQAWISLKRERFDDGSLDLKGWAVVKNANMGETGSAKIRLLPQFMLWTNG
jgi:hypothetical protein